MSLVFYGILNWTNSILCQDTNSDSSACNQTSPSITLAVTWSDIHCFYVVIDIAKDRPVMLHAG